MKKLLYIIPILIFLGCNQEIDTIEFKNKSFKIDSDTIDLGFLKLGTVQRTSFKLMNNSPWRAKISSMEYDKNYLTIPDNFEQIELESMTEQDVYLNFSSQIPGYISTTLSFYDEHNDPYKVIVRARISDIELTDFVVNDTIDLGVIAQNTRVASDYIIINTNNRLDRINYLKYDTDCIQLSQFLLNEYIPSRGKLPLRFFFLPKKIGAITTAIKILTRDSVAYNITIKGDVREASQFIHQDVHLGVVQVNQQTNGVYRIINTGDVDDKISNIEYDKSKISFDQEFIGKDFSKRSDIDFDFKYRHNEIGSDYTNITITTSDSVIHSLRIHANVRDAQLIIKDSIDLGEILPSTLYNSFYKVYNSTLEDDVIESIEYNGRFIDFFESYIESEVPLRSNTDLEFTFISHDAGHISTQLNIITRNKIIYNVFVKAFVNNLQLYKETRELVEFGFFPYSSNLFSKDIILKSDELVNEILPMTNFEHTGPWRKDNNDILTLNLEIISNSNESILKDEFIVSYPSSKQIFEISVYRDYNEALVYDKNSQSVYYRNGIFDSYREALLKFNLHLAEEGSLHKQETGSIEIQNNFEYDINFENIKENNESGTFAFTENSIVVPAKSKANINFIFTPNIEKLYTPSFSLTADFGMKIELNKEIKVNETQFKYKASVDQLSPMNAPVFTSSNTSGTSYRLIKKDGSEQNGIINHYVSFNLDGMPTNYTQIPINQGDQIIVENAGEINCVGFLYFTDSSPIPEDLFKNCTGLISLVYTFQNNTQISSIPENIFSTSTKLKYMKNTFSGCAQLTEIPEDLFKNNSELTSLSGVFTNCISIEEVPPRLFRNNPAITLMSTVFMNCTKITAIPTGLFKNNVAIQNFGSLFKGCSNLMTVPYDIFRYNSNATDFSYVFESCPKLLSLSTSIFPNISYVVNDAGEVYLSSGGTRVWFKDFISENNGVMYFLYDGNDFNNAPDVVGMNAEVRNTFSTTNSGYRIRLQNGDDQQWDGTRWITVP